MHSAVSTERIWSHLLLYFYFASHHHINFSQMVLVLPDSPRQGLGTIGNAVAYKIKPL